MLQCGVHCIKSLRVKTFEGLLLYITRCFFVQERHDGHYKKNEITGLT